MSENTTQPATQPRPMTMRYVLVAGIVIAAFLGSYSLAVARSSRTTTSLAESGQAATPVGAVAAAGSSSCACCGTGGSSEPIEGASTVEGDVQKLTVDTTAGSYNPNVITLKAGVPTEITFTQSGGCLAQVVFPELGISADLTAGDTTILLPALEAGDYTFSCGMQMVFGSITVK